jgi:hypothetical protein
VVHLTARTGGRSWSAPGRGGAPPRPNMRAGDGAGRPRAPLPPARRRRRHRRRSFAQLFVGEARRSPFRSVPLPVPSARSGGPRHAQARAELRRGAAGRGERTLILCDNQGQLERLQELLDELKVTRTRELGIGSLSGGFRPRRRESPPPASSPITRSFGGRGDSAGGGSSVAAPRWRASPRSSPATTWCTWTTVSVVPGMEQVRLGEEVFETLVIEYASGELLRVPVHRMDLDRAVGRRFGRPCRSHPRCTASAARTGAVPRRRRRRRSRR